MLRTDKLVGADFSRSKLDSVLAPSIPFRRGDHSLPVRIGNPYLVLVSVDDEGS